MKAKKTNTNAAACWKGWVRGNDAHFHFKTERISDLHKTKEIHVSGGGRPRSQLFDIRARQLQTNNRGKIHNNTKMKLNLETSLMKHLKLMTFSIYRSKNYREIWNWWTFSFTDWPKGGFSKACSSKGIIPLSLSTW